MKAPRKPSCPKKPDPPTKTILVPEYIYIYEKEINLIDLLSVIPQKISAKNIKLKRNDGDHWDAGDFTIEYQEEKPNTYFESDKVAYKKKLALYNKKMVKHEAEMKVYNVEQEKYLSWFRVEERRRKILEAKEKIAQAEKVLKKLK